MPEVSKEVLRRVVSAYKAGELSDSQLRAFYSKMKQSEEQPNASPLRKFLDSTKWARSLLGPTLLPGAYETAGVSTGEVKPGWGMDVIKAFARGTANLAGFGSPTSILGKEARSRLAAAPLQTIAETASSGAVIGGGVASIGERFAPSIERSATLRPAASKAATEAAEVAPIKGVPSSEIRKEVMRAMAESDERGKFPWAFRDSKFQQLEVERQGLMRRLRTEKLTKAQRSEIAATAGKIESQQKSIANRALRQSAEQHIDESLARRTKGRPKIDVDAMEADTAPIVDLDATPTTHTRELLRSVGASISNAARYAEKTMARPEVTLQRSRAGRVLNKLTQDANTAARWIEARALEPLHDALGGLRRSDRKWIKANFRSWYKEGRAFPNERIQRVADEWRNAHETIARAGQDPNVGLDFGIQKNYLPDYLTDETRLAMEAKKGPIWEALVRWGEKNNKDVRGWAENIYPSDNNALHVRKSGSLEFPKTLGLPDHLKVGGRNVAILDGDPLANMGRYIRGSSKRIGVVQFFGRDETTIRKILDMAGDNAFLRQQIKEQWRTVQGIGQSPGFYRSLGGRMAMGLESLARTAHLSASTLANLTAPVWSVYKYGLRNTLRAQWDVIRSWGGDKWNPIWNQDPALRVYMARMDGGWSRHTLGQLAGTEGMGGGYGLSKKIGDVSTNILKGTFLERVERNTNKVAGLAANQAVGDIFNRLRNPKVGKLWKLVGRDKEGLVRQMKRDFQWDNADIARIMENGLSRSDRARIAQRAPSLVNNFAEGTGQRPYWMRHPIAQRALAYTSFVRLRGNMVSDAIREMRHGNITPIVKMFGFSVAAGEAEIALKGWFKNKERVDKNFTYRLFNDLMASATFGYLGAVYEQAKYARGDDPFEKTVEVIAPPFYDAARDTYKAIETTIDKGIGKGIERTRRIAPGIDVVVGTGKRIFTPEAAKKEREKSARRRRMRMRKEVLP